MKSLLSVLQLLALFSMFSPFVHADDQIGIQCKYRDGWYILHTIEVSCLEPGCAYRIGTDQATVESGKVNRVERSDSQEDLNAFNIRFQTGTAVHVKATYGKHYQGILDFGSGNFGYHEKIRCKIRDR
jgi:hypothetical protein